MHGPVLTNCLFHRIRDGFATSDVQDSEYLSNGSTCRLLPRPARQVLRDEIEESDGSGDVGADHSVADAVECHLRAFLFREQRLLHNLPLHGIPQSTVQPTRLDLAFDQVVLSARM